MKKYKHLFFDLDHTLWDFDRNSEETLYELYHMHLKPHHKKVDVAGFISAYKKHNDGLWSSYHRGEINKKQLREQRFLRTFIEHNIDPVGLVTLMENEYLRICPSKPHLFENTIEVLDYLCDKYQLHIITNGFIEASGKKLENTGIRQYFRTVNISEIAGVQKPHAGIFEYALANAGASVCESVMIGDNLEADIAGALNFGMDAIFFNHRKTAHQLPVSHEIENLKALFAIL